MQEIRSKNEFGSWPVAKGIGFGSLAAPPEQRCRPCHCICAATVVHPPGTSRLISSLAHGLSNNTPVATETFKLLIAPAIGILIRKSHFSLVRRRSPRPSDPITRATAPRKSCSYKPDPALSSVPTSHTPCSFNCVSARERFETTKSSTVRCAGGTLRTVALTPTALSLGMMTAFTPAASADRRQAPRL